MASKHTLGTIIVLCGIVCGGTVQGSEENGNTMREYQKNNNTIQNRENTFANPKKCTEASMNITQVVIPAAGRGTRVANWSLSVPKEMLPVGLELEPGIAHVVKEAINSGCPNIIIIAGANKPEIGHYFEQSGLPANLMYIPQVPKPLGLGHAVLMAQPAIHNEYFGVILPDELLFGEEPGLKQLIDIARQEHASVIAVKEVPWDEVSAYGVIAIKQQINDRLMEVSALVEKPKKEEAPSNFALVGRYVLSPKILDSLAVTKPGAKNEIQLTDGIADMMSKGERVFAYKVTGKRYDIGTKLGFTKAVIGVSLQDPVHRNELIKFITHECSLEINQPTPAPKSETVLPARKTTQNQVTV